MNGYLTWYLNFGTREYQGLFKTMRDNGEIHPAELTKPALNAEDRRYHDAYRALSASRLWSQIGPNPIQVSEVAAYLSLLGIEDTETKLKYLRLIQGMDIIEMTSIRDKQPKG